MGSWSVTPCSAQRLVPCPRRLATPNPYGNVVSCSFFCTRPDVRIFATKGKFSSFEDMINSYDTVLLDAYATWCGPCQYMASVLKGVSAELKASGVQIIKLDTEKYPAVASRLQIAGLPTLILFKNGKPVARIEGALQPEDLKRWVAANRR